MLIVSKVFMGIKMSEKLKSKSEEPPQTLEMATECIRSAQSFYCYDLEEKIIDLTGPIQRKAQTIRAMLPVNWKPYLTAGIITEADYSFISVFQKVRRIEERKTLLEQYQLGAFKTLLKVVQEACSAEDIQKVLVLIDDMLWEDMSRVHGFEEAVDDPCKPFIDLLSHNDEFVKNVASRILVKILDTRDYEPPVLETEFFLNWLKNGIKRENPYLLCVARCLQQLLRQDLYREIFVSLNGLFRIVRLLDSGVKPQAQYQYAFCVWVSSYNVEIAEKLPEYKTIEVFAELLQSCPSEIIKLPRVILATFRNLLEKPRDQEVKTNNAILMIQGKVLKILSMVKSRSKNFGDEELLDDFEVVEVTLRKYVAKLSTFDVYELEVKSGLLEWSLVHTSKPFWDENAHRLNENNYELLKKLISLLEEAKDSTVVCVAAHDIGEYMKRYLRGRMLVEKFGGKDLLLKLIHDEDPEVKYHSLKSLQILMLSNYDVLINFHGEAGLKDFHMKKKSRLKPLI